MVVNVWIAALTLLTMLCLAVLLRHRRYLIELGRREERLHNEMRGLAQLLIGAGIRAKSDGLRERWSVEAPLGDKDIQAQCLKFLDSLEGGGDANSRK